LSNGNLGTQRKGNITSGGVDKGKGEKKNEQTWYLAFKNWANCAEGKTQRG